MFHDTPWLSPDHADDWQKNFLNDFCVTNFSYHTFYDFYQDMVQRIIALNCAVHTGCYRLTDNSSMDYGAGTGKAGNVETKEAQPPQYRLEALKELEKLQQEREEVRNLARKEKNLGTQVQLNTKIKQLTDRIEAVRSEL